MSRLVRPRTDRIIGGVCAGLGLYFGIDPVIVRLLFVVLAITTGLSVVLYPILWVIMPEVGTPPQLPAGARFDPQTGRPLSVDYTTSSQDAFWSADRPADTTTTPRPRILALVLVGVGTLILVNQVGTVLGVDFGSFVIPLALVGLGLYLLRGNR
jgi:phage shock protein C